MKPVKLQVLVSLLIVALGSTCCLCAGEDEEKTKKEIQASDIVLIDVSRVFKENAAFQAEMDEMKREVGEYEKVVRERQREIKQRAEDAVSEGVRERQMIEAEALRAMSDLEIEMKLKRKELLVREAHLYAATYEEIKTEVERYTKKQEIRLVLRFRSDTIDPDDRDSVLQSVNNNIVFQDRLDISDAIIERLNGKAALVKPHEETKYVSRKRSDN